MKTETTKPVISAEFVKAEPAVRDWIEYVFANPECNKGFSADGRDQKTIDNIMDGIEDGTVLCMIPAVDGVAAGLFWGRPVEGGLCTCHQVVLPRFRKHSSAIVKCVADETFKKSEWITHLMGFIPSDNRASVLVALRAGFKRIGNVTSLHITDKGARISCTVMARVKDEVVL